VSKRKESEVEFVNVFVVSCDGRLIEQRLEQLPPKDAPKVLTVIDGTGRRHTYTHDGKITRETLGPEPTKPTEILLPRSPAADPNAKPVVSERKPKRHSRIVRPPGNPPSPPAPPPATRPLLPRSV